MQGALDPPPGAAPSGSGLHALAVLVARALNDLGLGLVTQPAVAGIGGLSVRAPMEARMQAGATSTGAPPRHSARPRPSGPGGPGTAPAPEPDAEPVNDEHAETWRLVTLAQQGDGDAFGQLYDRYVDAVFRFIYFRVNDRALAEDFTSETFLRALRRITTVNYQGRDIGAWFVTIARNIVLDHMKSARHRLEISTDDTPERDDASAGPEDAVVDLLTSERLMAAVRQLGDEQRECVMLRFIQGFSVSETAAVMGKNDGAIKALQHRAVRKLAELVGGDLR
jgi:RNA polymerase sigma-70 factor (ECF subfamily)